MIKNILLGITGLVIVIGFLWSNEMDYQEAKAQESMYCQNVKAGIESNGKYGWGDFNENYDEVCK